MASVVNSCATAGCCKTFLQNTKYGIIKKLVYHKIVGKSEKYCFQHQVHFQMCRIAKCEMQDAEMQSSATLEMVGLGHQGLFVAQGQLIRCTGDDHCYRH